MCAAAYPPPRSDFCPPAAQYASDPPHHRIGAATPDMGGRRVRGVSSAYHIDCARQGCARSRQRRARSAFRRYRSCAVGSAGRCTGWACGGLGRSPGSPGMLNARAGRGSRARASAAAARRWALRPARPQLPAGGARRGVWPWSGSVRCEAAAMRGGKVQAQGSTPAAACGAAFAAAVPLAGRLLDAARPAAGPRRRHPRPVAAGRRQLHVPVLVCLATSSPISSSHLCRAQPVRPAPCNVQAQRAPPTRAAHGQPPTPVRPLSQCLPTQPPVADPAGCGWMAPCRRQRAAASVVGQLPPGAGAGGGGAGAAGSICAGSRYMIACIRHVRRGVPSTTFRLLPSCRAVRIRSAAPPHRRCDA
jgi:hypothetical protein